MVDDNCFEEISCEEFYGDPDQQLVDWNGELNTCLSAQATAQVLLTQYSGSAMRNLVFEMINSLDLCKRLIRSKISEEKDGI